MGQVAEVPATSSRQRWTLVLVCTAVFMLLDITVVSVALPSIQRELHASLADLQWVSAAYALVLAVLLLPAATTVGGAVLFALRRRCCGWSSPAWPWPGCWASSAPRELRAT